MVSKFGLLLFGSLIFLFVSLLLSESLNGTYSNIGIFIPVIVIAFLININNLDFNKNRSVLCGFQNGYYLSLCFFLCMIFVYLGLTVDLIVFAYIDNFKCCCF